MTGCPPYSHGVCKKTSLTGATKKNRTRVDRMVRPQFALALRARAILLVFEKFTRTYLFQVEFSDLAAFSQIRQYR